MPFSLRLLMLLAVVATVGSAIAPFVSWALAAIVGTAHRLSFPRVYDRVFEVLAVVTLVAGRRWLGLTSWAGLGLGQAARRRDVWLGLGIALGSMVVVLGLMYSFGELRLFWRYPFEKGMRKALAGTVGAAIVGTAEEVLFRGVLLGGLMREVRRGHAVAGTTAVYAVAHFLRGGRQVGEVTPASGFERLVGAFAPLADPGILPAFIGFVILGLLLAYARLRSGALYLPIGLHIGWVFTLRVGRIVMDFPQRPGLLWGQRHPPLLGGVVGWTALLVSFVVAHCVLQARVTSPPGAHG